MFTTEHESGGGAGGAGTGINNRIINWKQSQQNSFMGTLNSHLTGYSTWYPQGYSTFWAADIVGEVFAASVQDHLLNLQPQGET